MTAPDRMPPALLARVQAAVHAAKETRMDRYPDDAYDPYRDSVEANDLAEAREERAAELADEAHFAHRPRHCDGCGYEIDTGWLCWRCRDDGGLFR